MTRVFSLPTARGRRFFVLSGRKTANNRGKDALVPSNASDAAGARADDRVGDACCPRETLYAASTRALVRGGVGLIENAFAPPEVLDAAIAYCRARGRRKIVCPAPLSPFDFGGGAPVGDNLDVSPLIARGFRVLSESALYRFDLDALPDAFWTARPREVAVTREKLSRALASDVARVMGEDARHVYAALRAACACRSKTCMLLASGRDAPVGFLLGARDGTRARVITLWTDAAHRNGVAALPLLSFFAREMRAQGVHTVDAGVIERENAPSRRLAERLGGREIAVFRRYMRGQNVK